MMIDNLQIGSNSGKRYKWGFNGLIFGHLVIFHVFLKNIGSSGQCLKTILAYLESEKIYDIVRSLFRYI